MRSAVVATQQTMSLESEVPHRCMSRGHCLVDPIRALWFVLGRRRGLIWPCPCPARATSGDRETLRGRTVQQRRCHMIQFATNSTTL